MPASCNVFKEVIHHTVNTECPAWVSRRKRHQITCFGFTHTVQLNSVVLLVFEQLTEPCHARVCLGNLLVNSRPGRYTRVHLSRNFSSSLPIFSTCRLDTTLPTCSRPGLPISHDRQDFNRWYSACVITRLSHGTPYTGLSLKACSTPRAYVAPSP